MRRIPLTQGQFALVDDEDYDWLSQWKWCASQSRGRFYAVRKSEDNACIIMMHRVLCDSEELVDHKDGDSLNNQKDNLRPCTNQQNLQNRGRTKSNTSGYKGVSWNPKNKNWNAQITVSGRKIHLGTFGDKAHAAKAYDEAAEKYHGDFAKKNLTS